MQVNITLWGGGDIQGFVKELNFRNGENSLKMTYTCPFNQKITLLLDEITRVKKSQPRQKKQLREKTEPFIEISLELESWESASFGVCPNTVPEVILLRWGIKILYRNFRHSFKPKLSLKGKMTYFTPEFASYTTISVVPECHFKGM